MSFIEDKMVMESTRYLLIKSNILAILWLLTDLVCGFLDIFFVIRLTYFNKHLLFNYMKCAYTCTNM